MDADARRYSEEDEGVIYSLGLDDIRHFRFYDHTGRELGRFILPAARPEDEAFKVVFTSHGEGHHTLRIDWWVLGRMIPGWAWRWLRIKREIRNLWRMLRR